MSIKMYFGQTEIKIEAHIRDRKFTFTSAFDTVDHELDALQLEANGGVAIKPDENDYSEKLPPTYDQATSDIKPSSSSPAAPPKEMLNVPSKTEDSASIAESETTKQASVSEPMKQPSVVVTKSRKIFGFRFGKKG